LKINYYLIIIFLLFSYVCDQTKGPNPWSTQELLSIFREANFLLLILA